MTQIIDTHGIKYVNTNSDIAFGEVIIIEYSIIIFKIPSNILQPLTCHNTKKFEFTCLGKQLRVVLVRNHL